MKKQPIARMQTILCKKATTTTLAILLFSLTAAAQTKAVAIREPASSAAIVKHLGSPSGNLLFQVQYENAQGEKFSLVIKDNDGNTIFQDTYKARNFDKKFQLPQGEANKIKFIIKPQSQKQAQTFEVNTSTRMVEEILVNKIS